MSSISRYPPIFFYDIFWYAFVPESNFEFRSIKIKGDRAFGTADTHFNHGSLQLVALSFYILSAYVVNM